MVRGDVVWLTIGDWRTRAYVTLASANGRSVVVMFDGAAPLADGGYALGLMPLLKQDDGRWMEILRATEVTVEVEARR